MTSQYEMKFPFTAQKEILDWEILYCEGLSEKYQCLEPAVIDIKKAVEARQSHETPGQRLSHETRIDEAIRSRRWGFGQV